jgi:radical SAM superfamily enzyme YgiQ (UPF0313 family)
MANKIKSAVLVQPNLSWCSNQDFRTAWEVVPYNLSLLAAMIENEFEVKILDANIDDLNEDDFAQKISSIEPDVVGITMMTTEYAEAAHAAARIVKKVAPETITVLGGVYATTSYQTAIEDKSIDFIVIGEGEHTFPALLRYLNNSGPLPETGVIFRDNGSPVFTHKAGFVDDLDALPFPAYHLIDYPRYTNLIQRVGVDAPKRLPYARIRTSRGCPVGCSFCQVEQLAGKKFRPRSVDNVIQELKWQKEEYGIKSVLFNDDNLILNRKRAKNLFRAMIDNKLDLTWNATAVAVFSLDEEMIELMKESGCVYVDIAVESGNERILKEIINKPVNLSHAKKMAKKIRELGIYIVANFIIGFPGETWEEIRNTVKFAEDIDVDYVKIFIATPLKGTRLYDMVKEHNLLKDKNDDIEKRLDWSTSRIKTDEFTSKDLSILRAYEWDRINFTDPMKRIKAAKRMGISESELKSLRRKTLNSIKA